MPFVPLRVELKRARSITNETEPVSEDDASRPVQEKRQKTKNTVKAIDARREKKEKDFFIEHLHFIKITHFNSNNSRNQQNKKN